MDFGQLFRVKIGPWSMRDLFTLRFRAWILPNIASNDPKASWPSDDAACLESVWRPPKSFSTLRWVVLKTFL